MSQSAPFTYTVLDQLLATLDIAVTRFTACDIREGWSVSFEPCDSASVHYCLGGAGALKVKGKSIPLRRHTFVLLPAGLAYRLEAVGALPARLEHRARMIMAPAHESVPTMTVGVGDKGLSTACGELGIAAAGGPDLFASLDFPIVASFDDRNGLEDQFILLLAEFAQPGIGSRALVEALLKQCLVLALRRCVEADDTTLRWLVGVRDSRLGRALDMIFTQPGAALSVEGLAVMAGMSRSAFAATFREAFDCSPMTLVRMVRLRRAADLLVTTALPVAEIARRVGFSSRSSFFLAFRRFHGKHPSEFRRTPGASLDS
jgi:AraC-like DNA-binding protein